MPSITHLQGAAGVHAVCAQLCLRGMTPCMPSVDDGVDIYLTNGIKLQVKCGRLRNHPGFPSGAYCFDVRKGWKRKGHEIVDNTQAARDRNYDGIADFVVFWAIDESRFFVVPPSDIDQTFWIRPLRVVSLVRERKMKITEYEDAWHLLDVNAALIEVEEQEVFNG